MEKSLNKATKYIVAILCAAFVLCCAAAIGTTASAAKAPVNVGRTYYYEELKNSELAQKFYGVIREMADNGYLKDGKNEYDLVSGGVLGEGEVSRYVDGNSPEIPVALGAARDAFYMDNPDLFYADVYKLYLSAGMQNGKYVAFLGTGDADNYYTANTVTDATGANAAIAKYEEALSEVVEGAKAASGDVVEQIKYVNKYIAEHTEYDYGARENALSGVEYDGYVNTAYGSLVNGKAICGGYSRAFKAVMDRLEIPCVLIQGSGVSGKTLSGYESGPVAHMWNAVEIGDHWYGVDVTWNDGINAERYLLVGDDTLSVNHFEDGVISTSGFELSYPVLRPLDHGVNEDNNGFSFKDEGEIDGQKFGYEDADMSGETKTNLNLGVSYKGKSGKALKDENKYLVMKYTIPGGVERWADPLKVYENEGHDMSFGNYSLIMISPDVKSVQFAIVDFPSDDVFGRYDPEKLTDAHIIAISTVYTNKAYGTYYPAPRVIHRTPDEYGSMKSFDPLDISLEYSEKLVKKDGTPIADASEIEIAVKGNRHGDMSRYVVIENVVWDGEKNKLSFRFTPSRMFAHNVEVYTFELPNLMGETSKKDPEPGGYYSFKMKQVICPKVFNDGRLYMQVFGQPQFVSADDESMKGFADENGDPIVGDQRSQLMLVVNETSKTETAEMKEMLGADKGISEGNGLLASSTYQIDLQVCGIVRKVPAGSYMKVGFGFPDGYGPEDEGVTFTVYHYKRDNTGKITGVETVPCVITEYGIIATVESFSPFMVCAVEKDKAENLGKGVYAYVNGAGGTIDNEKVTSVRSGNGVTYTIKADDGYVLNDALLNGKSVADKISGGKLTLSYDDLADNNELEFTFVSERVKTYREGAGIVVSRPRYVVTAADMIKAVPHVTASPKKGMSPGAIAAAVIIPFVVVAVGAALVVYFIREKKNGSKKGGPKGGGTNKNAGAKKTAASAPAKRKPVGATAKGRR